MRICQLLVAGEARNAAEGVTFQRLNPLSGQVVTEAAAASVADATSAVPAAAAAF